MGSPLLQIEGLTLARDGHNILDDVNLAIQPGKVHALLGPNGSGKSTLALTIMGSSRYVPDAGRIIFDGQDITDLSIDERARLGITLAWQEPARFEGLLISEYLRIGMAKPSRDMIEAALTAVALPPALYLHRTLNDTLSGGERKRIELAGVYAMRPRLALLDEPDSGVDMLSMSEIKALIRHMAREGITPLLITHRDEMATAADSASLMCGGIIVRTGTSAEVQAYFKRMYRPHQGVAGQQPWLIPASNWRQS